MAGCRRLRWLPLATLSALIFVMDALVILTRSEHALGYAHTVLMVLMVAAALRAGFAANPQARDFTYGFAVFGLLTLLPAEFRPVRLLPMALVDGAADLAFGELAEDGTTREDTSLSRWLRQSTIMRPKPPANARSMPPRPVGKLTAPGHSSARPRRLLAAPWPDVENAPG